jgi:hypothetical protein
MQVSHLTALNEQRPAASMAAGRRCASETGRQLAVIVSATPVTA